ncbi:MAG: dockerin type I repeat-containing protein, partial [Ruminococcus sp.]|nr:dockerin type I repeat-containing protein [Ruminococcus sp.]
VSVYSLKPSESVEINWIQKHPQTKEIVNTTTLSFESSADGEITETDLYGWLPDSMSEGADYVKNNGEISIHDGYIVVCDEICWDGGYSMIVENTGTAELELVKNEKSNIRNIVPLGGGSITEVQVYKPFTSGQVKVTFKQAREWGEKDGKEIKKVVKYFNVDENGNISEIDSISAGDCNGDGQFTISDVVMFQKWLSGTGDLTDWKNADLTFDNKLDIFDLVLMKQAVIENMPTINYDYKEVSVDDITILKQEILSRYPDTDMKDFTFKYNPDHPQTYSQRKAFDIYYKGVKLKGDERYNICASVYERNDGLREVDMNFLKTPEEIMEVDTSVKHLSRYEMKKLLDSEEYPELTIYVDYEDKPVLAYRLEDENGGGATIYDAVTGEKIKYIPYLICVLPLEDF